MKGLLLKDWYVAKKLLKYYPVIWILYFLVTMLGKSGWLFSGGSWYIIVGVLFLPGHDKQWKWDVYSGTLPCSKAQIVSAKYLMGLIFQGLISLTLAVSQAIRLNIYDAFTWETYLTVIVGNASFMWIIFTSTLPLHFMNADKKRLMRIILGVVVIVISWLALEPLLDTGLQPRVSLAKYFPLICIAAVGLYALSWRLSIKLYEKREVV